MILDPGFNLVLRPMKYPVFNDLFNKKIGNSWTLNQIDLSADLIDLNKKISPRVKGLILRLLAFFATNESLVSNNLALNLYKHVNSPEARLYLSRQLYEESLHTQFYLTLLDRYSSNPEETHQAFVTNKMTPALQHKINFCLKWMNSVNSLDRLITIEDRRQFLMNLICFSNCVEGLFFSGAFASIFFLQSKGLFIGFAKAANNIFHEKREHAQAALEVIKIALLEEPNLFNEQMKDMIILMMEDAIDAEMAFAKNILDTGIEGLLLTDMRQYLEFAADQYLEELQIPVRYLVKNPFPFMEPPAKNEQEKKEATLSKQSAMTSPEETCGADL